MLLQGVNLMVVGMTAVAAFLTLLVCVMHLSSRFFETFGDRWPDSETEPLPHTDAVSTTQRDAHVAVILAAITAHRRRLG